MDICGDIHCELLQHMTGCKQSTAHVILQKVIHLGKEGPDALQSPAKLQLLENLLADPTKLNMEKQHWRLDALHRTKEELDQLLQHVLMWMAQARGMGRW